MIILFDFKRTIFLILVFVLAGPSSGMEILPKSENATTLLSSLTPPISEYTLVPMAQIHGTPPSYQTSVSSEDFDISNKLLQEKLESYCHRHAPEENLALKIKYNIKGPWLKALEDYKALYQMLNKNFKRTVHNQKKDYFLKILFNFVCNFENLFQTLKEDHSKYQESYDYLEKIVFPAYQKTWNLYMQAYESIFDTTTCFFGDLQFSGFHHSYVKHLFYTRDSQGFLLFTIYPHEHVEDDLYRTYVCYGQRDESLFWNREIIFKLTPEAKIIPITSPGFLVRNIDQIYSLELYRGAYGPIPYSLTKSLVSKFAWLTDHPGLHFVPAPKEYMPFEHKYGVTEDIPFLSPKMTKQITDVLKGLLNGQLNTFIARPMSPAEHMEAEYLFLNQLQKKLLLDQNDPDALYTLTLIQEEFPNQNLDDIIVHYEENLEALYQDEEKKKLEDEIRRQQEERRQMVITDAHNTKKQKRSNRRHYQNKLTQRKNEKQQQPPQTLNYNYDALARERAHQRLHQFKKQIENSSKVKFRNYVGMVNTMTQELRKLDMSITGRLNDGSHGVLKIAEEKLPLFRPHKGSDKSISARSAKGVLDRLMKQYFAALALNKSDD